MYSVMSLLHAAVTARERQAIDRQKHDGADHRHDEPDRLSGLIDPERAADPAAEQGPDTMPSMMITIMPPGSGPGIKNFATTPTMRPNTIQMRISMARLPARPADKGLIRFRLRYA